MASISAGSGVCGDRKGWYVISGQACMTYPHLGRLRMVPQRRCTPLDHISGQRRCVGRVVLQQKAVVLCHSRPKHIEDVPTDNRPALDCKA